MRVLVTGHKGYVGAVLVPLLVDVADEVVGLDSDLYRRCTFDGDLITVPTIQKDIRDIVAGDLEGFDAIIHLAGLSNDPLGELNPRVTMEVNYQAAVSLAELARRAGVGRMIISSSCSVYGAAGEGIATELSACRPVTAYARSKLMLERHIATLANDDFSPTFLRCATAYGASPRIRFDLVLNNLVAWAVSSGRILLKSDGSAWRPLVHVEDISRAFVQVLLASRNAVHNQTFNVGATEEVYRVRDLADLVAEFVRDARVEMVPDAIRDKRCYRVNCDKLASTFPGYQLRWNARRGAQQLTAVCRRVGVDSQDFEGARYERVAHIRSLLADGTLDKSLRYQERTAHESPI